MPDVEIEYCVSCKLLSHAIDVARDLLNHHGHRLGSLRLKPGSGGVFKVRLDDTLVWDGDVATFQVDDIRQHVENELEVAV